MVVKVIEPAEGLAVSIDDAKIYCRNDIVGEAEDSTFTRLINQANEKIINITGRAMLSQKYRLTLDAFPFCAKDRFGIEIPMPPLVSIDSFKYIDVNGDEAELSEDDYILDDQSEPSWIFPAYGKQWPVARCAPNAVKIEFTAGYGDAEENTIPASATVWMLAQISHWYRNREASGEQLFVNPEYNGLLDGLKVFNFG